MRERDKLLRGNAERKNESEKVPPSDTERASFKEKLSLFKVIFTKSTFEIWVDKNNWLRVWPHLAMQILFF